MEEKTDVKQEKQLLNEIINYKFQIVQYETDMTKLLQERGFSSQQIENYFQHTEKLNNLQMALNKSQSELNKLQYMILNHENISASFSSSPSSPSDQNISKQIALEISRNYAEQQKQISSLLLENADLKKTIAQTEAENASLTVEICELKGILDHLKNNENASSQSAGSAHSTIPLDSPTPPSDDYQFSQSFQYSDFDSISELEAKKNRLIKKSEEIDGLRKEIDSEVAHIENSSSSVFNTNAYQINNQQNSEPLQNSHEKTDFSNAEFQTALSQLNHKNEKLKKKIDQQNKVIKMYEKALDLTSNKASSDYHESQKSYNSDKKLKKENQRLVNENMKLTYELAQLKIDNKEMVKRKQTIFNGNLKGISINVFARELISRMNYFNLKMDFFAAKFSAKLSNINLLMEHFSTTWNRLSLIYNQHITSLPLK